MLRTFSDETSAVETASEETLDAATEIFLQEMVEAEHFSGGVMVVRAGRVMHKRAYGPSSEAAENRIDGRFHVGSIGKQFTAAAVMQLTERGKVKLEGPINDFLPDHYQSDIWDAVTVQHLLSHTSGIVDYAVTRDYYTCLLYTSPSPRDRSVSRMPSSA